MVDRWTAGDIGDLSGRVALVTGANAGLGLEVSRQLARHGARVLLACRNPAKADAALADLRGGDPSGEFESVDLDLASLGSVRRLAGDLGQRTDRLDLLVNNAGLMALDESRTEDGFETQFGVNHLGHFALTAGLMPLLRSTTGSRVVTVSSMGHRLGHLDLSDPMFERRRYGRWTAYYQSKLANILFARELERRLELDRATTSSLAAHPGGTNTDLGSEGTSITNRIIRAAYPLTTMPVEQGALPILRAAVDPAARGGEFYGPHLIAVGRPVRETPSRRARDATTGLGLWELSERLTGEPLL